MWSQSLRAGAGAAAAAQQVGAGKIGNWRCRRGGGRRDFRHSLGVGGAIRQATPQIAECRERRKTVEQRVGMEVVNLAEADGHRRARQFQPQFRREERHHLVEVIAVHRHRLAEPPRSAAEIAGHQDAEGQVRIGPRQLVGLFAHIQLYRRKGTASHGI